MASAGSGSATRTEVEVSTCSVSNVVVYLDRADVTRSVQVNLAHGENEIVVKQLSSAIDSDSIRVEGRGQAVIGEVQYRERHVTVDQDGDTAKPEAPTSAAATATKELEKEESHLQKLLSRVEANQTRFGKQRTLLQNLAGKMKPVVVAELPTAAHPITVSKFKKKVVVLPPPPAEEVSPLRGPAAASNSDGGVSILELLTGDTLDDVVAFTEYYASKTRDLDQSLATLKEEKSALTTQLHAVNENLKLRRGKMGKEILKGTDVERTVTIYVVCEKQATSATLLLSYVVMEAGWSPKYDLRVFSKDGLLKIHYFALISQSTGEDWEDAPLVLSTAQPSIGGSPPELGTKKLSIRPELTRNQISMYYESTGSRQVKGQQHLRKACVPDLDYECCYESDGSDGEETVRSSMPPGAGRGMAPAPDLARTSAEVKGTITSTSFEIPRRTTIPADRTGHKVSVAIIDLQPSFEYEAVPKLVSHAFLKAQVKNTSPYALLKGPANVFLDNNFISKTSLDDVSPYEDFTCSLGVDPAVRVVYKPVRRFKENAGLFSKWTMVTMKQSIEVKNTRLETVKVKVTDTLPMSSEEKIKVSLLKPELTRKDPTRVLANGSVTLTKLNLLEWQVDIAASSQHTVELTYSVEYPAERLGVNGL